MPATLYGINVSPFVRKVRAYMAEKGLAYDLEIINPFEPPADYRDISPLGKIPAYKDGDKILADSSIICIYLERTHPTPALYPSDDYGYARALWFEEYMDSGFVPKAGGNVFFPLVIGPKMMNQPVTAEIQAGVDKCLAEEIQPMWQYLDKELGSNDYFVGNQLSIAGSRGHQRPREPLPRRHRCRCRSLSEPRRVSPAHVRSTFIQGPHR